MLSICNLTYFLNYFYKNICKMAKKHYLCTHKISRSGAVVARWAHNPKVVRSSRASATLGKGL